MVKLTPEDKNLFKQEIMKMNPVEILAVSKFIEGSTLSKNDKKYCNSWIGKRSERLLRNVVKNLRSGELGFSDY